MKNAGRSRFVASQGNVPVVLYPSDQFPTIASIPTGAVVYDTVDGVVKRKVGDYLVDIQYNVIGYGPIADAPVASEALRGSYFIQTDDPAWPNGRRWLYRRGLSNVGMDYVNLGRPSQLVDLFVPANDFTVEIIIGKVVLDSTYVFAWRDGSVTPTSQLSILIGNDITGSSCDIFGQRITTSVVGVTKPFRFRVYKKGNTVYFNVNGVVVSALLTGSYLSYGNLYLGGRTDGTVGNFEGDTCCFRAWAGANADGSTDNLTPVVNWRLDEPAGSTQVIDSVNGLIGTVSDGSPTGYVGTPMLVPDQW